jgi:hypothetical protein
MQLPGRLKATTLGDLLGALARARATGTLELAEDAGRVHRVHIAEGRVVAVELDGAAPSLAEILRRDRAADDDVLRRSLLRAMASGRLHGEVLVGEFRVAAPVVGAALRCQALARLAAIDRLADARVAFRVAVRPPRGALHDSPLEPREFLHGRRRARSARAAVPRDPRAPTPVDAIPWRVLGLRPGADEAEIKRAYRRLARSVHPDLHPQASAEERRELELRFAELTEAYRRVRMEGDAPPARLSDSG